MTDAERLVYNQKLRAQDAHAHRSARETREYTWVYGVFVASVAASAGAAYANAPRVELVCEAMAVVALFAAVVLDVHLRAVVPWPTRVLCGAMLASVVALALVDVAEARAAFT